MFSYAAPTVKQESPTIGGTVRNATSFIRAFGAKKQSVLSSYDLPAALLSLNIDFEYVLRRILASHFVSKWVLNVDKSLRWLVPQAQCQRSGKNPPWERPTRSGCWPAESLKQLETLKQ